MAEERKAFEAAILAANGQVPGNYNPEYDRYVSERLQGQYEGWKLARAQLPSQGGEAVEVVAYMDENSCLWNDTTHPGRMTQLMTVAQHQRILAAATHPADQVDGVVVSRELAEKLLIWARCAVSEDYDSANESVKELRAILGKGHEENT